MSRIPPPRPHCRACDDIMIPARGFRPPPDARALGVAWYATHLSVSLAAALAATRAAADLRLPGTLTLALTLAALAAWNLTSYRRETHARRARVTRVKAQSRAYPDGYVCPRCLAFDKGPAHATHHDHHPADTLEMSFRDLQGATRGP